MLGKEIGAIRYNAGKALKLLGPEANGKVINVITKNGVPFDSFGKMNAENLNGLLSKIGDAMGKKVKPVASGETFKYINAHGVTQILDGAGKEVLQVCEKVKRPILTLIRHTFGKL